MHSLVRPAGHDDHLDLHDMAVSVHPPNSYQIEGAWFECAGAGGFAIFWLCPVRVTNRLAVMVKRGMACLQPACAQVPAYLPCYEACLIQHRLHHF